jgi:hypothetical protein
MTWASQTIPTNRTPVAGVEPIRLDLPAGSVARIEQKEGRGKWSNPRPLVQFHRTCRLGENRHSHVVATEGADTKLIRREYK